MKQLMRNLSVLVGFTLLIVGCISPTPSQISDDPTNTDVISPTEVSSPQQQPETSTSFTIQADADLQAPISALFQSFFVGETPTFVDSDADLVADYSSETFDQQGEVPATFMPGAILVPKMSSPEIVDFIDFAISSQGQQILVENGYLPSSVTLTDQAGNTMEIAQPVLSVISSYGPATALMYGVDAEDRLISASYLGARDPMGAAAMAKIDPRFEAIIGDDYFTQQDFNVEQAAMLNPDLIITSARTSWLDTVEQLSIPVFLIDAETPDRLKEAVLLTGRIFGPHSTAQAEAWVGYYDKIISMVVDQTEILSEEERVRVLFTGTDPLRVASGEMYQTDIIEFAGGISVSSELGGYWNDINLEQVVIWDPDLIIVPPYGGASVEAITGSEAWQILEAVQAGRVYRMPKLVVPWDTPAPDSVLGVVWMAELLYPDRVDLSCSAETEYFYNTFYNYAITAEEIDTICQFE